MRFIKVCTYQGPIKSEEVFQYLNVGHITRVYQDEETDMTLIDTVSKNEIVVENSIEEVLEILTNIGLYFGGR